MGTSDPNWHARPEPRKKPLPVTVINVPPSIGPALGINVCTTHGSATVSELELSVKSCALLLTRTLPTPASPTPSNEQTISLEDSQVTYAAVMLESLHAVPGKKFWPMTLKDTLSLLEITEGDTESISTRSWYKKVIKLLLKSTPFSLTSTVTRPGPCGGVVQFSRVSDTRRATTSLSANRHRRSRDIPKFLPETTTIVPPY